MTIIKAPEADKGAKAELINQYRPLGLKAVLAAALQLKGKPAAKGRPRTPLGVSLRD